MIKTFKPFTPSNRHTILLNNDKTNNKNLIKIKKLIYGYSKNFGKNNQGKITSKHKSSGHKKKYRNISFYRNNVVGVIQQIEYDPNRSAKIALIHNQITNQFNYILSSKDMNINDRIESGNNVIIKDGNSLPLKNIPIGSLIYNISLKKNNKGKLVRSAGTFAQLLQKNCKKYAKIKLPSGQQKYILLDCFASLGIVSNQNHKNIKKGKAGRSRWLGKRPKVRGVAKNPVDHPHGGGEGKTSGGRPSVSFTGKITKGKPTVIKKYLIK